MSSTLVWVAELQQHLNDADWRVFDCRHDLTNPESGLQAYHQGHIPGAWHLHLDHDLSSAKTGLNGRHPLPAAAVFANHIAKFGITGKTQVVAYDADYGVFAARLWWLLRALGHKNVAVLDGGLAAWRRAGLPVSDQATPLPSPAQTGADDGEFQRMPTVDMGYVRQHLNDDAVLIIDARSPERFAGEVEPLDPVAGHIPGAVNRPCIDNLDDNGAGFKSADQLRQDFEELLAGRSPACVVQQCGSGVTACHNLLAMEIAGLPGARLYAGSWSEWCADPQRPVAR